MRDLLAFPTRRSLLAALPLVVAGLFLVVLRRPRDEVELTLLLEVQIIGLFPLIVGPLRARPRTWVGQAVRFGWVALMIATFMARSSHEAAGWWGVVMMIWLLAATYGPALLEPDGERGFRRMILRWVVGFVALIVACVASGRLVGWNESVARQSWWAAICLVLLAVYEAFQPADSSRDAWILRRPWRSSEMAARKAVVRDLG